MRRCAAREQLTSGVYYVFQIVGIDADGAQSEPQNYTVTYSEGTLRRTNPDGSIVSADARNRGVFETRTFEGRTEYFT